MKLLETVALVFTMLMVGSFNTINTKFQFQTVCPTLPVGSGTHLFNKPWLANLCMFGGETLLLIPLAIRSMAKRRRKAKKGVLTEPLIESEKVPAYIFAIPAFCDVFATGVSSVAMMYIDAAVWQMMRGSIIVFSAILSVTFLRRMLHLYHWVGVFFTVIGLGLIGASAVMGQPASEAKTGQMGTGILLVIIASMFSAFQYTFEEYLLTGYSVSSMKTVGTEGVWGIGYMCIILTIMTNVKGSDHGSFESLSDGVYMLSHSVMLEFLMMSYMMSIAIYNFVAMQLCRKLSAVTRCLVDSMRTATVWGFELGVHYFISKQYGQAWNRYSWIQAVGFFFLVLGSFIYNGVIRLPAMDYRRLERGSSQKLLRATWSPTANRAAKWGFGSKYGPQSPHSPDSPGVSPLPVPFGSPPSSNGETEERFKGEVIMEGVEE